MHNQARDFTLFVKNILPGYFQNKKVLDVGAGDNNRFLFDNCDYEGNDVTQAKNVTIVSRTKDLPFQDNSFDTIISTECFEHDPDYAESWKKIYKMLKPGGLFVFTCASTGRHEHGTRKTTPEDSYSCLGNIPDMQDYYKNLTGDDLDDVLNLDNTFSVWNTYYETTSHDLYFVGIKNDGNVREKLPLYNNNVVNTSNRDFFLSEKSLANCADYWFDETCNPRNYDIRIPILLNQHPNTLKNNCIIYICTHSLQYFTNFQSQIKVKYKIICGFSDYTLPYINQSNPWNGFEKFIQDPNLICIYAPNVDIVHPKVIPIPLGISRSCPYKEDKSDIMLWCCNNWQVEIVNNYFKPFVGISPLEKMRSKRNCKNLVYIRYTMCNTDNPLVARFTNFRYKLAYYLNENKINWHKNVIPWNEYMNEAQNYKYCLQPYGQCPNAYRMFESIIVGVVPIFFNSPTAKAFEGLPVLVLDNVEQLNTEYLEKKYEEIVSKEYDFSRLYSKYWIDIIQKF